MVRNYCIGFILVLMVSFSLYSQPQQTSMYCRGGLFSNGYLAMTNLALPNGSGNDYVWVSPAQTSVSGNYNLTYNVSSSTATAGKYWGANNSTIPVNTSTTFQVSSADAHWVTVAGKKYVFTLKDVASGANSVGYIFELGGTPATISSVSNSFAVENTEVTVTANMSAAVVSGQTVYVRWSTSSTFATSTVTPMTGSASIYTASIPGLPGTSVVYYYCFSSGVSGLTSANCNTATINASATSNYTVNGTTPTLILSPAALTNFTYPYTYGPSTSQSYLLSGALLTGYPGNITVSASPNFEVSTDSSVFTSTSVSIPFTSSKLNATPIYVRLKAGLPQAVYTSESIVNSGGSATATVTCNGSVTSSDPTLTVTPASMTGFGYTAGSGPSLSQRFSLSGKYLTGYPGNIIVTASTNYEVSADNITFSGSSVSVPFTSSSLSTVIYVRLKAGLEAGSYSAEVITNTVSGATAVNVICTGNVLAIGTNNQTYWWNDAVFYQIFVRSYYDSNGNGIGDLSGLMQKLDYLNTGNPSTKTDLGVTAVWLMPIMQSPSYHGYDVTDYKTIEQDYGTNAQFKAFLDTAHARGIKVIIDLVLNHTSDQHPWFVDSKSGTSSTHRNWYIWNTTNPGYVGPWGEQVWYSSNGAYYYGVFTNTMPDLNYKNTDVKSTVAGIVDYWLDTVKVDGFRLDGARYLVEDGTVLADAPSNLAYWREFRTHYKSINPNAMTVGEVWTSTSAVIPYVDGTGLDICFEFDTATDLINCINSGNPAVLKTQMDNVVTQKYPFLQYATFLTNHDQTRVLSQLNGNINYAKLAASVLLTMPGVPFIYYGEEIGMTSGSDDPSKRTPLQWTNGTNAGFTTGSPWKAVNSNYTTNNIQTMGADSTSILSWYKKLIRIREQYTALRRGDYLSMSCTNSNLYSFGRSYKTDNNQELVIPIHNFNTSSVTNPVLSYSGATASGCKPGTYSLKDAITNKNAGQLVIQNDGSMSFTPAITIAADGTAILTAELLTGTGSNQKFTGIESFTLQQNYPNPFNPSTVISYAIPQASDVKITVFNALGQMVQVLESTHKNAGVFEVSFNGSGLNSGIYFYKLEAGSFSQTKKMLLIK